MGNAKRRFEDLDDVEKGIYLLKIEEDDLGVEDEDDYDAVIDDCGLFDDELPRAATLEK